MPHTAAPAYVCVREVRAPEAFVEVPSWFDDWFEETFPEPDGAGYTGRELARLLGRSTDTVYAALYAGALEGSRVSGRGWLIPRPAVRLWLLECNAANDVQVSEGTDYWRHRKGLLDAEA